MNSYFDQNNNAVHAICQQLFPGSVAYTHCDVNVADNVNFMVRR